MEHSHPTTRANVSRVCEKCIRAKAKCDLKRPACSRCESRGLHCVYSAIRRKPGPPRGVAQRGGAVPPRSDTTRAEAVMNSDREMGRAEMTSPASIETSDICSPISSQNSLSAAEEELLLERYFSTIHNSCPIFPQARYLPTFQASLYSKDLVLAICLVTARLTSFESASSTINIEHQISVMLSQISVEGDLCSDSPSLDKFRKACLLTFYETYQFPGQQARMRACFVICMAKWVGLDRFESLADSWPHKTAGTRHELEDWRYVFWCIYRLDTFVHVPAGTSCLINVQLLGTALAQDQDKDSRLNESRPLEDGKLFLPRQPGKLAEVVRLIPSYSASTSTLNMSIITMTVLRQVGQVIWGRGIRNPEETATCLIEARHQLTQVRLALPRGYLNPQRNAFANETGSAHHERLVTVMHLHMSRLLLSISECTIESDLGKWELGWQQVLESCQDIAAISEQWDSTYTLKTSPGVSIILFTALLFFDVQKKVATNQAAFDTATTQHCETVLLLQLEQFATTWTLSRLQILSLNGFRESLKGPLDYSQVKSILARFEAPLHPRWLQFLSSAMITT